MTNPDTAKWSEDIAEIIIGHFPNASRKVLQEMSEEFEALLAKLDMESRLDELGGVGEFQSNLELPFKLGLKPYIDGRIVYLTNHKDGA